MAEACILKRSSRQATVDLTSVTQQFALLDVQILKPLVLHIKN